MSFLCVAVRREVREKKENIKYQVIQSVCKEVEPFMVIC